MKKAKQILAILGIIALVGLYASTIIAALFDPTSTMNYLMASIGATIVIPVFIWVIELFFKLAPNKDAEDETSFTDSSDSENDDSDKN